MIERPFAVTVRISNSQHFNSKGTIILAFRESYRQKSRAKYQNYYKNVVPSPYNYRFSIVF